MNRLLAKQLKQLEHMEEKILNEQDNAVFKANISPVMEKIQEKIPEKLKETLEMAFYKGFQLVFEKGNAYIEKTYNKDKIQLEHDLNNYALDKRLNHKFMRNLDKPSTASNLINTSISVIEGGVLGALGIGLPDIPLFLAVMIKTINEVALSYGFTYDTREEKTFILLLIQTSLSASGKRKELNNQLDQMSASIDRNIRMEIDFDKQLKQTAQVLSEALLTIKFIQGFPIIGAVGGLVNFNIIQKIGRFSKIKYKKRYLTNKYINVQN